MKKVSREQTRNFTKRTKNLCLSVFICGLIICFSVSFYSLENEDVSLEKQIDSALYRREEFFGTQAIVPIPTAEAYENLLKLADKKEPKIFAKLGEFAEKLEKFEEAEDYFRKAGNLTDLANFYQRRGKYLQKAETLEQILQKEKRLEVFEELVNFAQIHEIEKYLQPDFFQQFAGESEDTLLIIEKLVDRLVAENQTEKALEIIRQYKPKFPEKMLEKEVELLSPKEAETVYYQSFNPFWSNEQAANFYDFLSRNDRLRAYGSELKANFRQNPTDYQTAIRLIHYKQNDYDDITPIVLQLEKAKKTWASDELLTIARFLLKSGNGDLASKFLYTLHTRNEFTFEMRGKISYQIFKILCDAENERLSLTKGDLNFYRDVASADTHPGITTGILSLIFSDTHPSQKLIEKERVAAKLFNRAMAYRVFQNYKNEFPSSPEIGQMYLDLITIYTRANEPETAGKLLDEFAENYEKSADFPRVALNLADAFVIALKRDEEQKIYQKLMDFLGKEGKFSLPKVIEKDKAEDFGGSEKKYTDLVTNENKQMTYADVLRRYVESLSKSKKVAEILEFYSNEIAKYPDQEWLYEQRLNWLEQTNMFDEQFEFYKLALEKFPTNNWRDKLARWFIRNKKQAEVAEFSNELVEKLNDSELESYLSKFTDNNSLFDEKLYLKLYETAHQRFPHNLSFVNKLLKFYKEKRRDADWRKLSAEYYFESSELRKEFLDELTRNGELQNYFNRANGESVIYELFRADANLQLSRYEEALQSYRKLNEIYPNSPEFSNHLVNLTRSFGQKDRQILNESANFAKKRADFEISNAIYRTESGEINAELNDYKTAKNEWQKLLETGKGASETYLETAAVFWDYYQYDEALQTIRDYRAKSKDKTVYAFESGAILESLHKQNEAISEYVEALEKDEFGKARKRLKILAEKGFFNQINAIFEQQEKSDWKTLYYAKVLRDLEKIGQADSLLRRQISRSKDAEFLYEAGEFSDEIEPLALNRLAEISTSPKDSISYRLQEADFYRENNQPAQAKQVLANLQQKFPTNYGVLTESANFYWSLGASEAAIQVLQKGFAASRGSYRFIFASRLAKRLISLNRLAEAEQFLVELHQENPTDSQVFHELANVYVRQGKAENLRQKFAETVTAIKAQSIETKDVDEEIGSIRRQMISAFTQLKDYHSAVEQHIEIINRQPDEDENVDVAISYVKRYGNADLLLNYYQKTAAEAFKNYRWNVVLAKIFEANGNAENAVKNYYKAIDNQPEMTELYAEIVRIERNRKNYAEALKNLDQIIELSGEEKNLIKQKVELLQLLGRSEEAKAEQEKLPVEAKPNVKTENQFAKAEKAKSIEMFRTAFENLLEKPLENELKAENITSYITNLRHEENLDVITERLFSLRKKLLTEAERRNSKLAGEARNRLKIFDAAVSQTVGNIAKTVGTDEELEKLHHNLSQRIDEVPTDEQNGTMAFLQDFSARAGFGDLVEKVLIKRRNLTALTAFYNERGAFQKVLEIAETENNLLLIAENARLLGNREKELEALRQLFQDKNVSQAIVSRYLQTVDKAEIEALSKQNSPHQLQLINFLLGKGEKELAHQAIEHSDFGTAWKLSRHAETSLALKEFGEDNECYFCDALKFGTIGDLASAQPDKTQHLIGADWFGLSREYGEWLDAKKEVDADKFLPAMIEFLPNAAGEQAKLGEYYLAKNDLEKAREHFQISLELNEENTSARAKLGEILWRLGERQKADEIFADLLEKDVPIYLQTLKNIGLHRQGLEKAFQFLWIHLQDDQKDSVLLEPVLQTFDSEGEKADYFLKICQKMDNEEFTEKLLKQGYIAKEFRQPFYARLIKSNNYNSYNYEFEEVVRRTFSNEEAEEVYDHEKDFVLKDDENLIWQRELLENLLENGKNAEAKKLILQIESELKGKLPRPIWLRLAHYQLFGGNLQRLIGIEVTDNVANTKPPSVERLNEAVAMLRKLKRDAEAEKLTLTFYARMLELEQFETANFIGLARQYLKLGDSENALKTLQNLSELENFSDYKAVAELCAEFGQTAKAIEARRKLLEISPNDFENIFELARLLPKENSVEVLQSLVNDRNTPRALRWRAIWKLYEFGELNRISDQKFDVFSQFYNGLSTRRENYFLNSLIADKDAELEHLQELIKVYADSEKPFAALKLAEIDKTAKNDEILNLLSESAQKVGEFQKAIEFESAKSKIDEARIGALKLLEIEQNKRATEFTVDAENTRKL